MVSCPHLWYNKVALQGSTLFKPNPTKMKTNVSDGVLLLTASLLTKQYKRYIKIDDPIVYKHLGLENRNDIKFQVRAIKNATHEINDPEPTRY